MGSIPRTAAWPKLALEDLPDRQRTLIELAYWSCLSQSEIATELNIPLGTVETRTCGALTRLAALLDHDELEEPGQPCWLLSRGRRPPRPSPSMRARPKTH
jgi:Sigma-70, region 4